MKAASLVALKDGHLVAAMAALMAVSMAWQWADKLAVS